MACVEIQARIDKYKLIIANYEDALAFLSLNPRKSYSIDTGQTKESVTVLDMDKITDTIETIEGIIARLERQCAGYDGPTFSRAVWQ
jgi:hypothetical protein